ncbi:uncharacterized protein G2W53_011719 [Senna tora]|uniref:Uncharacterized protein n=1 Tax=Senna tora TaxID=362788 RepID=A0A834X397_9FABA|nr:uncharacterized protein G2W53_011719 [Senna tora]
MAVVLILSLRREQKMLVATNTKILYFNFGAFSSP